jgi:hypothetical protein
MRPVRFGLLMGVLLGATSGTAFAQSIEWRPMEFRDLRQKSSTDILQTMIWPAEIRSQNDFVEKELKRDLGGRNAWINALVSTFALGDQRLVVSVLTSRQCDNGANHNASGREASVCPLKIVLVSSGNVQIAIEDTGCLVEPPEQGAPLATQHDSVQVQFDPARRVVRMRALVGGQWAPRCSREFRVP